MTQTNLGNALWTLGEREGKLKHLMEARRCIDAAYLLFKKAGHSQYNEYFED